MKREQFFYIGFLLLSFCFLGWAANFNSLKIPTLTVTVSDFTLDYSPASRTVTIAPQTGGATQTDTSDSNGLVTFNVVTPGLYTLTISGVGVNPLTILVPNQTGTVEAKNIVVSDWTPPSQAVVLSPTDNLRGWSLIPTNALPSGDTVWTNELGTIKPATVPTNGSVSVILNQVDGDIAAGAFNLESWANNPTATNRGVINLLVDSTIGAPFAEASTYANDADGTLFSIDAFASPSGTYFSVSSGTTNYLYADATGISSQVGFGSSASDAAVNIAATGWTNTFGKNALVFFDGGQITFKVYNGAGTAVYTNAIAVTNSMVILQPSGKVTISGNSVKGSAIPF